MPPWLAPALFICAGTGASCVACRPGGEAAHRGGWGDREIGRRDIINPDEDSGFLDSATPGDVVESTEKRLYEIIGVWVSAGFRGPTDTH